MHGKGGPLSRVLGEGRSDGGPPLKILLVPAVGAGKVQGARERAWAALDVRFAPPVAWTPTREFRIHGQAASDGLEGLSTAPHRALIGPNRPARGFRDCSRVRDFPGVARHSSWIDNALLADPLEAWA